MEGEPRKSHPIFPGMTTVLLSRDRRLVRAAFEFRAPTRIGLSASPTEVSEGNGATTPHRHSAPRPPPPVIPAKAGNHAPLPASSSQARAATKPIPKIAQIKRITVQDHAAPQPPGTWTPAFATPPRHSGESRKPRAPAGIPLPSPGGNQTNPKNHPNQTNHSSRPRRPPTPRDMGPGFRRGDGVGPSGRRSRANHAGAASASRL